MINIPTPKKAGIRRIPPEILSEIYIHCLPADSASQDTQQLLSSVCRLWRAVALATPALWASLDITCDGSILRPPLPIIRTHLQRSGIHPLSFALRAADRERFDSAKPHLPIVLTLLTAARQRWCNVHIELFGMTQDILDLIMLGDAPLLQSMRYDVMETQDKFPIPLRMLDCCPRLELFQVHSHGPPLLLPLANTPLTSLSLQTFISASECVVILRLCPRLSSAEFYGLYHSDPSPAPHLTHPTLSTLIAAGEYPPTLLATLTLPSLLDLMIETEYPVTPLLAGWEITLPAFLERSNPTLHQLTLSMIDMRSHEPAILRILTLTPHLRSLSLGLSDDLPDPPPFSDALIHALYPPPPPGVPLCPCLQELQLSQVSDCPDGLCTAMLRARWGAQARGNGVACLGRVHIGLIGGVHDRDQADAKELHAEGMRGEIVSLGRVVM